MHQPRKLGPEELCMVPKTHGPRKLSPKELGIVESIAGLAKEHSVRKQLRSPQLDHGDEVSNTAHKPTMADTSVASLPIDVFEHKKRKHYAKVNVQHNENDDGSNTQTSPKHNTIKTHTNRQKNTHKRSKIFENRSEFPYGSVVSINGMHMDGSRWDSVHDAPTFLGIVQNPYNHDGWEAENINEDTESYVTFALYGHYKWDPNDMNNHLSGKFEDTYLNIISLPPNDTKPRRNFGDKDPLRHFEKGEGEWVFKNHKNACETCGSPWCKLKKNKKVISEIVSFMKVTGGGMSNKGKRFRCYLSAANEILQYTGEGYRTQLGYCILDFVRSAFPEKNPENYTGFKMYSKNMSPYEGDSSDTS